MQHHTWGRSPQAAGTESGEEATGMLSFNTDYCSTAFRLADNLRHFMPATQAILYAVVSIRPPLASRLLERCGYNGEQIVRLCARNLFEVNRSDNIEMEGFMNMAHFRFRVDGLASMAIRDPKSAFPRCRRLCVNSKKVKYRGRFSCEMPRWGRSQLRNNDHTPSIVLT